MMDLTVEWHWKHHDVDAAQLLQPGVLPHYLAAAEQRGQHDGANFEVLPASDEISQYVKIKENMYAFCLTEEMMERKHGASGMFRSNNMVFIQNTTDVPCRPHLRLEHDGQKGRPCRTLSVPSSIPSASSTTGRPPRIRSRSEKGARRMIEQYGGVYIPNLANTAEKYGIGEYRFAHNYETGRAKS
jgi:hypothetical protein